MRKEARLVIRLVVIALAAVFLWSTPSQSQSAPCEYRFPCMGNCGDDEQMWMQWKCWNAETGEITSQGIIGMEMCCDSW